MALLIGFVGGNVMKEKIEACFDRLQNLDIKATLPNMENLLQTLYDLRDVYNKLGGEDNGGRSLNLDGRNDH